MYGKKDKGALSNLVQWKVFLPLAGRLELHEIWGPFQPKLLYNSMALRSSVWLLLKQRQQKNQTQNHPPKPPLFLLIVSLTQITWFLEEEGRDIVYPYEQQWMWRMERAKQDRQEKVKNNNSVSHFNKKVHSIEYYTEWNNDQAISINLKAKSLQQDCFQSGTFISE